MRTDFSRTIDFGCRGFSRLGLVVTIGCLHFSVFGSSTIDPANRYAYGANLGWMDGYANGTNGAVIGSYVCSGFIYSANVGWINLGNGSPANGIQYKNNTAADFGVNQDGLGDLRGYAYGANIGWINFEDIGAPSVNLMTGQLSGYVWSANCGWISLSNSVAYVQTDSISAGALDTNGLPIAWELTFFGHTGVDPNADPDADGASNYQEYLAGTNPTNGSDSLVITGADFAGNGTNVTITFNSVLSRFYFVQKTEGLDSPNWGDSGLGLISPAGPTTSVSFGDDDAPARFYRVKAVRPLTP